MAGARSSFPWALLIVLALLAGLGHLRPVNDLDTPWHLTQGARFLEEGRSAYPDNVSFTVPGKTYVNHPWLGELIMLAFFRVGGFAALSIFAALGAFFVVLSIGWSAWEYSDRRPWITLLATALASATVSFRMEPRPLVLFLIFLPVGLVLLKRYAEAEGRSLFYYAGGLLLLQLIWIPTHGSYILLPVLVLGGLAHTWRTKGMHTALRRLSLPVGLVILVLVLTDLATHASLIQNVALGDATTYIREMRPLRVEQLLTAYPNSILFLDLLLLLGLVRAFQRGRIHPEDVAFVLLGLALAFTAHRFRAAWGVLAIPWVVRPGSAAAESRALRFVALIAMITAVPAVIANDVRRDPIRGFGAGLARDAFPVDAARFLKNVGVEGNLLNLYDDGGYLALELGPRVRIAIDGRTPTLFDDELYFLIRQVSRNPAAFAVFAREYRPEMVLIDPGRPLCRHLQAHPDWRPVLVDFDRTLFFSRGFFESVPGLSALDGCAAVQSVHAGCRQGRAEMLIRDLDRMRAVVPDAPHPLALSARLLGDCLQDHAQAQAFAEAALASGTRRPGPMLTYARTLFAQEAWPQVIQAADHAYALGAGPTARLLIARAHVGAGGKQEGPRGLPVGRWRAR